MKKTQFLTYTLLLASTFLLPIEIANAQLKTTLEGHTDLVWSVAFNPNGRRLASGSWDGTIRLWNVNTGQLLHILMGHTDTVMSVAFSPDDKTLASGSWDGTIRLWNPNNGKLRRTLTEHSGGVASVAFSPDGQTLASGSADQTIRLWNTKTWKLERTLRGHTHIVDVVAFSPDGRTLASGSRDQTIRLWNPNNGNLKGTLTGHTSDVSRMMFSPNGRTLASGSRDQTVRLWNPNTGQHKRTLTNRGGWTNPAVFSPDGSTLLIGGRGISIWDIQTDEYKKPLTGDIGTALSVVFSPDGQMVASGSADNKVRLWEYNASDYEFPTITRNPIVRVIHFIPNDRSVQPERVSALRRFIKDTQQYFADEMERHGFGRKTFSVETNKSGEPVVQRIDGKFPDDHYSRPGLGWKVWTEVREYFDDNDLQDILLVILDGKDTGGEATINYYDKNIGVTGMESYITREEEGYGGFAVVAVADDHFIGVTAHELGHAFGLLHDYREGSEDSLMGGSRERISKCSAEWLSVSHFFNNEPISPNKPTDIQLLSTQAYSQNTVSLRFKVTDPDGLHHAQLLLPELNPDGVSVPRTMFDCKELNGKTSTFESAVRTAVLIDRVTLQVIDVNGNITWATFPIELDAVLSERNALDINSDGIVNISDMTRIASQLGRRGNNPADVNEDRIVDTADLLLVAASSPSVSPQEVETLVAADVHKWLTDAKQLRIENEYQQKGVVFLEFLSAEIALLSKPTRVAKAPLKAIFEAHVDLVNSVAFSPDGQTLATGGTDNTIRLWDTHTASLKMLLIGHTDLINSVAFSPDGQTLASASPDTTVRLWNTRTGEPKTTLRAHSGFGYIGFFSVAFSPDGQTLAAGGDYSDPTIRFWNLHNEENIRTLTGHRDTISSLAFSPDGQTLASASWDTTVRLWNPNNGGLKRTLTGHTRWVESVTFSPDGQTLASASRDGTIRLWNPDTGDEKKILTGNTDWIKQIAFGPDGEKLATGSLDRKVRMWDIQTGEYTDVPEEDARSVVAVAFSPDGQTLASSRADARVQLWDAQMLLERRDESTTSQPVPVLSVDVNGDGVVNILDLVSVSANFGKTGENIADVNGDGIVNIVDLVKVAGEMGAGAAAPASHPQTLEILTATDVRHWLTQAQHADLTDSISQRGILMLQQLLAALIPKETSLLPNYPNPFNPETWIPYQLAESSDVRLVIYNVQGIPIRVLSIGHQPAGFYIDRTRAAYWDGRNALGERVASGVYFYQLQAGDVSPLRKMLILK